MKRTAAQEKAVYLRNQDILVSAAAGSGKTRVLIDRIVAMVSEEYISLEEMLVVTFTRAAAGELKDRLAKGLEDALQLAVAAGDQERIKFLRHQLTALPQANVSTLHAFCAKMLRRHFQAAGVEPNFRVLQSAPASKLLNEALTDVFDAAYESGEDQFSDLIWAYGTANDDANVRRIVTRLLQAARAHPVPSAWLDQLGQEAPEVLPKAVTSAFQQVLEATAEQMMAALESMARLLESPEADRLSPYRDTLAEDQGLVTAVDQAACLQVPEALALLTDLQPARLKAVRLKKEDDEAVRDLQETFKRLRESGIKAPLTHLRKLLPAGGMAQVIADRQGTLPRLYALGQLTKAVMERYEALKAGKNSLDFADLETRFLALLADEESQAMIRRETAYIFFDEYQDANQIQEEIIKALATPRQLFFVGDVKQAIYRFRQSDPALFLARYHAYEGKEQGDEALIHLSENFRSQPRILHACNAVFQPLMTPALGDIDYSAPGQALVPGQDPSEVDRPVEFVWLTDDQVPQDVSPHYAEARWIADRIRRLVEEEGKHYRDMAVLMRTPRTHLAEYEQAFSDAEVPYYSENSLVGFENMEVRLFLDMLRVIDNDSYDEPLLAVLVSPFGGCSDDDLAKIRLQEPEGRFSAAARWVAAEGEGPTAGKLQLFYDRLDRYRLRLKMISPDLFAEELLQSSGYGDFLQAMPHGAERYANVCALIDLMRAYGDFSHAGLDGFLRHVEEIKKAPGDSLQPAVALTEQDDCVRIMSIHKSKGLGFDTVFLADLYHRFNMRDTSEALLVHPSLGCALDVVQLDKHTVRPSFEKKLSAFRMRRENISEEVRLLYVAMTRAINRLFLVGRTPEKEGPSLGDGALPFALAAGRSYGDWLHTLTEAGLLPTADLCITREEISWELADGQGRLQPSDLPLDPQALKELTRRLAQAYPYAEAAEEPYKKTVSQLSAENRLVDDVSGAWPTYFKGALAKEHHRRPDFLDGKWHFTAREQGTLLHRAVQLLPNQPYTAEQLTQALEDLVQRALMTVDEVAAIERPLLLDYYASDTAAVLRQYQDSVEQEVSFTMFYEDHLIDGQIDLIYRDDAGYHIIDFKSDRQVQPEDYRLQLELYAKALAEARRVPVISKSLYWLRHGVRTIIQ